MPDEPGIPLAEAIEELRAEILSAMTMGANAPFQFKLHPIEIELTVTLTRDASARAGIKFWVVDAGAEGKLGQSSTQKLKLTLEPVARDGRSEFLISQLGVPEPK